MHGVALNRQTSDIAPECSFPKKNIYQINRNRMSAEISKRTQRKKNMSIWRDHVTVILYGYIKYMNAIEDEF